MAGCVRCVIAFLVLLSVAYQAFASIDDSDRDFVSFPYGRGMDSDLQMARLFLLSPRFYHPKRNSELINSLLGLPKNINNAGK